MAGNEPVRDLMVIGAGPAGLFCAIHAAAAGLSVTVLEKNAGAAKKLLISGTGQCNFTHDGPVGDFFSRYGEHGNFLKPALRSFANTDLIGYFAAHGVPAGTGENGKVFPRSRRATDILAVLLGECNRLSVDLRYSSSVTGLARTGDLFRTTCGQESFLSRAVVIATGGESYPGTGSTGDGYRLASALGQEVAETGPALTPLLIRDFPFSGLAGISFTGTRFSVWRTGRKVLDGSGDVLFTHTGLSGPGILDISRSVRAGDQVRLSFAGGLPEEEVRRILEREIAAHGTRAVKSLFLAAGVPDRLARFLPEYLGIPPDIVCAHLTRGMRTDILRAITACPLDVSGLGGFGIAMVTRGGVALTGVNPKTMESRQVPGLFFAGEVLDIDGDTGGYNLQAAFSTAYLAAQGAVLSRGQRSADVRGNANTARTAPLG